VLIFFEEERLFLVVKAEEGYHWDIFVGEIKAGEGVGVGFKVWDNNIFEVVVGGFVGEA